MYIIFADGREIQEILIRNGYEYSETVCQDFLDAIDPDYDVDSFFWEDRDELEEILADIIAGEIEEFLEEEAETRVGLIVYTMHEKVYNELFGE